MQTGALGSFPIVSHTKLSTGSRTTPEKLIPGLFLERRVEYKIVVIVLLKWSDKYIIVKLRLGPREERDERSEGKTLAGSVTVQLAELWMAADVNSLLVVVNK